MSLVFVLFLFGELEAVKNTKFLRGDRWETSKRLNFTKLNQQRSELTAPLKHV